MSHNEPIPFLDLRSLHQELEAELLPIFLQTVRTASFIGGPMVEEFEREFARFCDTSHCVGVGSGTDAVRFALTAVGVKPGDIVVTVPHTFIATTEAISQAGARPDFVDIDERTHCMDVVKLLRYFEQECSFEAGRLVHRKLRARVSAVVPVHIYGQMADMDPILELADRYQVKVVEDACQAHGAEYFSRHQKAWKKAGSMGHAGAFSFYPGKNLGACGEAGAITTNDATVARTCSMLRDHGQSQKYYHDMEGFNGRLDAMQAGFLTAKLRHLADWNRKRRQAALRYNELFSSANGVTCVLVPEFSRPVYHLYVIRVKDRVALQQNLTDAGIGTGIHYPVPLHLQKAYEHLSYGPGSFPVSERIASEIVSLPMYPQLSFEQIRRIADEVKGSIPAHAVSSIPKATPVQPLAQM
jgi:dTDP-4-amino-4,6-dideoxygalactose transaminase